MNTTLYSKIEKWLNDWHEFGDYSLKNSELVNVNFLDWCGVPFNQFIEKLHPKRIQRKLNTKINGIDLFYDSTGYIENSGCSFIGIAKIRYSANSPR